MRKVYVNMIEGQQRIIRGKMLKGLKHLVYRHSCRVAIIDLTLSLKNRPISPRYNV